MLLFALLLASTIVAGQKSNSNNAPDRLTFILQSMERAQADVQLPRRVTREYHFGSPEKTDSEVVAEIDFTPPGKYSIRSHAGSSRAEQVVKRILEHEIEIALSAEKSQSTAVTRDNYDFRYLGTAVLVGHRCYLLQMNPKRDQPELISGRAWIDQQSFLIRRMEGQLAKSPSWWIKKANVDLAFLSTADTWLQISMTAVVDVRVLGAQKLTSRMLDYETAPLAAKNVGGPRTSPISLSAH